MGRGKKADAGWRSLVLALSLALLGLALLASGAGAATICVGVSSASCETSEPTIFKAFEDAASSPAGDRIVIGPGRFEGYFHYIAPAGSGRIEVVGQGPGTVLTAPAGTKGEEILQVIGDPEGDGSLVSNLTVRIPSNTNATGDTGILAGSVSSVRVASDAGEPVEGERIGVLLTEPGGSMKNSVVEMVDGSGGDTGVKTDGSGHGAPISIYDSRIVAPLGIYASIQPTSIVRDRVTGSSSGVLACNSPVTVEDSLLRVVGAGTGLVAEGSNMCSPEQGSITARQVTIVGGGPSSNSTGAAVYSGNPGQSPRVDMLLSIVRGVTTAFRATGIAPESSATITAGASDFEAGRVVESGVLGASSFSEPEADIDADPLFTSDLLGEFTPRTGSPAIDSAYSPPLAAGESTTDLSGDPRVADGNGDGVAARDMGAFEAPAVPDKTPPETRIVKPKKARKKLRAGSRGYLLKVRFESSESGSRFECRLDAGKFAVCASPFKKRISAGLHRFEVRAIDAAGNADPTPARESFRIAKAASPKHRGHGGHHRAL